MKKLSILLLFSLGYFWLYYTSHAVINFSVTPIVHHIDTQTGATIYKVASLRNNGDTPVDILTTKSDFQANGTTWVPEFVRKSELVYPEQELSTWITLQSAGFTIHPWQTIDVPFIIQVPNNATPGGHYWAVCFKNNSSETSSWWKIPINVDYCSIILLKVDGEIITEAEVSETTINSWNGWGWWESSSPTIQPDDCLIDLTASNYDGKCIDNPLEDLDTAEEETELESAEDVEIDLDDFSINFDTEFINEWNTHIMPEGSVTLIDSEGNQIKWVWKETIKNDEWAKIGEKIVDYLPINDEWWNVLPNQKRKFNVQWKWFPYKWYDEDGNEVIKYWTPDEYYTKNNIDASGYLYPWERVCERINHEKIKALIDVSYINKDWEKVEYSSAKEFYITYKEKYIGINPYFTGCSFLLLLLWIFLWFIFRRKKIICINENCQKKLEKDMKYCPYCRINQEDGRFKKNKVKKKKESKNNKDTEEKSKKKKDEKSKKKKKDKDKKSKKKNKKA